MKDAAETSYRAAVFKRDNQACFLDHTNRQKQNCLYIHASAKKNCGDRAGLFLQG